MRKVQELKQYVDLHGINVPVIGNVYVLNAGVARTMNKNQIPGAVVPDSLLRHLETFPKGKEGRPRFLEHAAKMFAVVRGLGYQGVHLGGFGLKVEEVKEIIERADEFQPAWQDHLREMVYPMEPKERQFYFFETDPATGLNTTTPVDRKKTGEPQGRRADSAIARCALFHAPRLRAAHARLLARPARLPRRRRQPLPERRRPLVREAIEGGDRRLP